MGDVGGRGRGIVPVMKFGFIDDHYSSKLFQVLVLYKVDNFSIAFFTKKEWMEKRGGGWSYPGGNGPTPGGVGLPLSPTAYPPYHSYLI